MFKIMICALVASVVFGATLERGLELLEKNEKIKSAVIDFDRAENNVDFLKGNVYPDINLNGTYSKLGPGTGIDSKDTSLLSVSLTQPLFRGLREFKTIEASKLYSKSKNYIKDSITRELKSLFVEEYFSLLSLFKERDLTQRLLDLSNKRVKEISDRVRIGKSKKADLYTAKSQAFSAESLLQEINSRIEKAKISISLLVNRQMEMTNMIEPKEITDLFIHKNYDGYPTLKTYEALKEAAKLGLKISKGAHLPSVDLKANYYAAKSNLSSQRDWDASVVLTLPLYEGGKTSADVTDKALAINQAEYDLLSAKKSVVQMIDTILTEYQTGQRRIDLLFKSKNAAKTSYEELLREYNLGLITNLDVIQSLNQYIDAEKNYYKTLYTVQGSAYRYKILTENI